MARPQEIDKNAIIKTAEDIINRDGYDNFSMRKLAIECNVAVSTIYLHFQNKVEILIEISKNFWEKCFSTLNFEGCNDFFESTQKLYFHVLSYLENFKTGLLGSFLSMQKSDKETGKKIMNVYVGRIQNFLTEQIVNQQQNFDMQFLKSVEKIDLISFVYRNIKSMLMEFNHDYDFFDKALKKLLLK